MWLCRSPRMSAELDQLREPAGRGGRLQLAAVLAQLGLDVGEAEPLVDLGLGRVGHRRVPSPAASSRIPYSETCRPRRTAASRSAALCRPGAREVLEKAPEGGRTRRSAGPRRRRRAFARGRRPGSRSSRSRSPRTTSRRSSKRLGILARRHDVDVLDGVRAAPDRAGQPDLGPSAGAVEQPGDDRVADLPRAREQDAPGAVRRLLRPRARSRASTLCSNFGPSPLTVRRRSPSAASRSVSSESMPSSE